jgi:hypothetical protein
MGLAIVLIRLKPFARHPLVLEREESLSFTGVIG